MEAPQEKPARIAGASLQTKIFLLVALAILLVAVSCGTWMRSLLSEALASQTSAKAKALSSYIAARSVDPYLTSDLYSLYDLLDDAVANNEDVVYAFIVNEEGELVASAGGKTTSSALIEANWPAYDQEEYVEHSVALDTDHGPVADCAVPLFRDLQTSVRLGMGYESAYAATQSIMERFSLFVCVVIALVAAIAFASVRSVLKDVRSLVSLTEKVSSGDLGSRAATKRRDEVGRLAGSFNAMLDELQEAEAYRERYVQDLAAKEETLAKLLRKTIDAQEDERKRIARELHDETSHSLSAMLIELQNLRTAGPLSEAQTDRTKELRALIEETLDDINRLAQNLRPSVLDKFGLAVSLERYLEEIEDRHGIATSLLIRGDTTALSSDVEITVFRIAQEAVTNALKYAEASELDISLVVNASATLIVEDNGKGFDASAVAQLEPGKHLGLLGMDERVSMHGGKLDIESKIGEGTTIIARIPLKGFVMQR